LRRVMRVALVLVGMFLTTMVCHQWSTWAAGRAPATTTAVPQDERSASFAEGKRLFREGHYAQATPFFEQAQEQSPEDPWAELYLRISQARVQQQTAGLALAPPVISKPAIIRVIGAPPVRIHPVAKPPPPPAAPPIPPAAPPAPPERLSAPAPGEAPPLSPRPPAPPAAVEPTPEVLEPVVPYPQEVPLPAPGPLTTAPAPDVPVQAHADVIEFSPETQQVVGHGHVRITHEGLLLTCDRVIVFSETRDALAEGHVRLTGPEGVLTGETVYYNFRTKKGTVLHGGGEFFPWYGRGPHVVKTAEHTLRIRNGYVTTCELDPPHYRFQSKQATVYLDDKVVAKHVWFIVGNTRLWYMPRWSYSLRENRQKWSFFPGKKKPWGQFLLGKYRYELTANAKGTFHWDWRRYFGHAQGLDFKYRTRHLGYGLLRTYYNEEPDQHKRKEELLKGQDHDRYRVLLRHRWDIAPSTNFLVDFQKYSDVDFRRDFLFREEFQSDTEPESFALLTHTRPMSTLTALFKRRVNRFQTVTELLPEAKWELLEQRVWDTPFFYASSVAASNSNHKPARSDDRDDDTASVDIVNELKYGWRLLRYLHVTPRGSVQQTYYRKDDPGGDDRADGKRHYLVGAAKLGVDASTKLYRLFDVQANLFGVAIQQLRHVITPAVGFSWAPASTLLAGHPTAAGIGGSRQRTFSLGLENKLQAKQLIGDREQKVDMGRLLLSSSYDNVVTKEAWQLSNITADLELQPHPNLRIESDTSYDHRQDVFPTWNLDVVFSGDPVVARTPLTALELRERGSEEILEMKRPRWFIGVGHRYQRESRSEMTLDLRWQPHPKWWVDWFNRFTYKEVAGSAKRINRNREFQIIVTRDLHDWLMQVTVGEDRDLGGVFLLSFVLKAFPEIPLSLEDSYHQPKHGSQSSAFYAGTPYYTPPTTTP